MGTRSDIIVRRTDGKWARIYCHWDGYLEHNGKILAMHYNSQERAEALVKLGDLSSLKPLCDKPPGHSFDSPVKGYCIAYGRDRGETETKAILFASANAAWPDSDTPTEFTYLWDGSRWFVGDADRGLQAAVPLESALKGEAEVLPNVKAFGVNFVIGTRKSGKAKHAKAATAPKGDAR